MHMLHRKVAICAAEAAARNAEVMYEQNEAAIHSTETAATCAEAAWAGAKEVTDAIASIQETKKAVDDAKEYLLKANANANACAIVAAQESNAFVLKTTSDAFNSPAMMSTAAADIACAALEYAEDAASLMCAFSAAKTATADAARAALEYADACDAAYAAKDTLLIAIVDMQDMATQTIAATRAATTVVSRATGST